MEDGKLTTGEAAERLGISRQHINVVITRHPELRPQVKLKTSRFSAYLWAEDEIQALAQYVNRNKQGDPQEGKNKE